MSGKRERLRIYFTGVGGQGTLTATNLLAHAAMEAGLEAVAGEVHGMAQRGGVVESALLLGGYRAPRLDFGEADIILGFEALETLRGLPYLVPGGIVFSSTDELPPLDVALGNAEYPSLQTIENEVGKIASKAVFIPCHKLGQEAGAVQSGNTALLGAVMASGVLPFGTEALQSAIENCLPEKIRQVNLKALRLGEQFFLELQ